MVDHYLLLTVASRKQSFFVDSLDVFMLYMRVFGKEHMGGNILSVCSVGVYPPSLKRGTSLAYSLRNIILAKCHYLYI